MPNTVTVPRLREAYKATFNRNCDLTYSQIWKLWMLTAHGNRRGKHVPMAVLEERMTDTVQLMDREWDNLSARPMLYTCPMCGKSMRAPASTEERKCTQK